MIVDVFLLIRNLNRELFERKTTKKFPKNKETSWFNGRFSCQHNTWSNIYFGLKQGAAGAAIATVLGNLIADIYYVYVMIKKLTDCQCQLAMQRFRLQWLETFLL